MDLSSALRRFATPRPLVVAAPGAHRTRFAVEAALRARGWTAVDSPARADVLVACGRPGPELTAALDVVFDQLPTPRARVLVDDPSQVDDALTEARDLLADTAAQRDDHAARSAGPEDGDMPGSLDMAGSAPDRDGLGLEQLHVSLGPALTAWPAGLRLDVAIQGDVVQEAAVVAVDDAVAVDDDPRVLALDALATLLLVLGWDGAAGRAQVVRDGGNGVDALARRLRGSRRLHAATRGLGVHDGLDARDRLLRMLDVAAGADAPLPTADPAALVVGAELATARVVVASLDPYRVGVPA
ncbi:hypothetical protein GCM10027047_03130 [Rhodococcus aerolatus]